MNKKVTNNVNNNLKNINIYDIPGFFANERIRRILVLCDITTLEDFFHAIENSNLITMLQPTSIILKEILATIKLLSCKYLDENPNIIINDSMSTEQIINELGLSFETGYELIRMKRDEDLYQKLSKMHLEEKILYFRKNSNMTEVSLKEIAHKLQIIDDYNNLKMLNSIKNEVKASDNNEVKSSDNNEVKSSDNNEVKATNDKDNVKFVERNTTSKSKNKKNKRGKNFQKKEENEEEMFAKFRETINLLPRARGK